MVDILVEILFRFRKINEGMKKEKVVF